jgi:hypothetical protein
MASNKELTEQAEALGKSLGVEVQTDGINNKRLEDLVAELTAKKESAASAAAAATVHKPLPRHAPVTGVRPFDGASENQLGGPPKPQPEPPRQFECQVAKGRVITCLRGQLKAGDEVRPEFLSSDEGVGKATMRDLIAKGCLVEGKPRGPARAS